MYVFVRRDLTPSQQAIQACHACIESARNLLTETDIVPYLVLIGIQDEQRLLCELERIQSLGIQCKSFREPDIGNELTAFATGVVLNNARKHFKKYQLLTIAPPKKMWGTLFRRSVGVFSNLFLEKGKVK